MAFALVRPRSLTMGELRRALPAQTIAKMMVTGALMGVLPRYNDRGEEDGPADPLSAAQRIDLADKLMKKVLPDLKTDEPVDTTAPDPEALAADPTAMRRLSTAQIRAAIEADFVAQHTTFSETHARPVAPPEHVPVTTDPIPDAAPRSPEPPRRKRARALPPP